VPFYVASSGQFISAFVPLTKYCGPFLAIDCGGDFATAGAAQLYGFIMEGQKLLGLAG